MENKLKHLEFIQNTIVRMGSNSFLLKGWAITLISALFALAAKDANTTYVFISYLIIPVFWGLDGYFLSVERQYRELFAEVSAKQENEIDFNMDASSFNSFKCSWFGSFISGTLLLFYGISITATITIILLLK